MSILSHNFSIQVRGTRWKVILFSDLEYPDGTESRAQCQTETREIHFKKSEIKESIVRHELLHAYIASAFLPEDIDNFTLEEQCAEIFENFGPQMIRQSKQIFKKLKEIK